MSSDPVTLNYQPKPARKPLVRDDLAYILPMGVFLAWIWVGTKGPETEYGNAWYPWTYVARTVVVGARNRFRRDMGSPSRALEGSVGGSR